MNDLAKQLNVSDDIVQQALEGCARRLVEWFGNAEAAAAALEESPELSAAALQDYSKTFKKMCVKVHQNPKKFAEVVDRYSNINGETISGAV